MSQWGIDTRGAKVTDMNKSARRIESAASSSFSPDPNLSNRANAASIFLFVAGDFCPRVKYAFRYMRTIVPGVVPGACQ